MTSDTKEFRIEEAVNDIVERMWDVITSDDDMILDRIDDLAGDLGVAPPYENDPGIALRQIKQYEELMGDVTRAAWMGLIGKIGEELCQLKLRKIEDRYS